MNMNLQSRFPFRCHAVQTPVSLSLRSSEIMGLRCTPVQLPAQHATSARQSLVRAAKREEELKEIRAMSNSDIEQAVVDLKGELFLLRARQATRLEFKASEFGRIRKRVSYVQFPFCWVLLAVWDGGSPTRT